MHWITASTLLIICTSFWTELTAQSQTQVDSDKINNGIITHKNEAKKTDETAAKLIALNIKARGGIEAMDALKSLRIVYLRKEAQEDYEETLSMKKPFKIHLETYRNHLGWDHRSVKVFNGKEAWIEELLPEKRKPETLKALDFSLFLFEGELLGSFYQYEKKGHVFNYRGKSTVSGKPVYIIHGILKYGLEVDFYIDTETFQILKYRLPDVFAGKETTVERFPLGLRKVAGVWMETGFDYRINDKIYRRVTLKEVVPNAEIIESDFTKKTVKEIWLK